MDDFPGMTSGVFRNFRKFPEIFRKRRGFSRDFEGKIRGFFRVFRLYSFVTTSKMTDFPGTISGIFRNFRNFRKISEKFPNFGISEIRKIPEISENFPRRVFFEIFYIFLYFTLCTDVFVIIKNYKNYWTDIYRG